LCGQSKEEKDVTHGKETSGAGRSSTRYNDGVDCSCVTP
jgi:hypothetical protein